MLGHALEALFPRRCAGCGRGPWPFCRACRAEVVVLAPPWCQRCGAPALRDAPRCRDCPPEPLALARAPFHFHGPVRSAVHRLKFSGWRGISEALGQAMAASWGREADVVAWVPLSKRRLAERGFDQARALAAVVAERLDLPLARLLARDGDPEGSQARRGREERLAAMRGRFHAVAPPPARVLLVDDVLTTGATAAACARALAGAGATEISLLTAARAVSGQGAGAILRPGLVSGSVVARGAASR